jgi:hypothetical protein
VIHSRMSRSDRDASPYRRGGIHHGHAEAATVGPLELYESRGQGAQTPGRSTQTIGQGERCNGDKPSATE